MTKQNKMNYLYTISAIIFLRAIDLILTYIYTPNLIQEWNPLVSKLGLSWMGMLITQTLLVGIIAFFIYFYFAWDLKINYPKGLTFNKFINYYFFEENKALIKKAVSYKRPVFFNGFVFSVVTIWISVLAILNNALIIADIKTYNIFIAKYQHIFFTSTLCLVTIMSMYVFFLLEFRKYKKAFINQPE